MLSIEELRSTLTEALFHYRDTLAISESERRDDLPRKGKMPATEVDDLVQQAYQAQLEAVNRFLDSVDDMVSVVIKPIEKHVPRRAQSPIPENLELPTDPYMYQNDEPFINPFSGQLVEPITPFTPGPSAREGPWKDVPSENLDLKAKNRLPPDTSITTYQDVFQTQNINLPDLRGGSIGLSNLRDSQLHAKIRPISVSPQLKDNGNYSNPYLVPSQKVETMIQEQASRDSTTDRIGLCSQQSKTLATEVPLLASSIPTRATSQTPGSANPFGSGFWISRAHADIETYLEHPSHNALSRSEVPGKSVAESKPPILAPTKNQTQTVPSQPMLENDPRTHKEIDNEIIDSFFPMKPRSGGRTSGQRPLRGPKPQRMKTVIERREVGRNTQGGLLTTLSDTNKSVSPNPPESGVLKTTPPATSHPRPQIPVDISRSAKEVSSSGVPLPGQVKHWQNWWEVPEGGQSHTQNSNQFPNSKSSGEQKSYLPLGREPTDTHKPNIERNHPVKQHFEPAEPLSDLQKRIERLGQKFPEQQTDGFHIQHLNTQQPKKEPPKWTVTSQQLETDRQHVIKLQRESEQMSRDMDLAEQLTLELSTVHENPSKANFNKPADRKPTESSDPISQFQSQRDREPAEQAVGSYDESIDPETLALLTMLADGVPQDYNAFREQDEATQRLIKELAGGTSQDLDEIRKIQAQDQELARQLAEDSPQDHQEYMRQLTEQEEFARNTQRMLEEEHKRHMEEEAAYARKAQEAWNQEVAKREEEARRRAEVYRQEEAKREEERKRAEAAQRKRLAEEKAAKEAEVRKAKEAEERRRKERMATCLVCQEESDKSAMAVLSCMHAYCRDCITHAFTQAMKDRKPFRCCSSVPISSIAKHFNIKFINEYNYLMLELTTPNPLYCGVKSCSKFIPPNSIHGDTGTCNTCSKKTCRHCRLPDHTGICAEDKGAAAVHELARKKGWKACPGCKTMIERHDGCLHMTCITCRAEFCYNCGQHYSRCPGTCKR